MSQQKVRRSLQICLVAASCLVGLGLGRKWVGFPWLSLVFIGGFLGYISYTRTRILHCVGLVLVGLAFGGWRGSLVKAAIDSYDNYYARPVVVLGKAVTDGVYAESRNLSFDLTNLSLLDPEQVKLPGTIKVEARGVPAVYRGDQLVVTGQLYRAGGSKQGSIKFATAKLLGRKSHWLEKFRLEFMAAMQNALPEPVASFALGILVGQRSTLPKDVSDQLSTVGLTHIIAVSGYNLTIIIRFVNKQLAGLSKYQTMLVCLGLIWLFILITGMSASIVRAGLVSVISLLAWYYGRTFKPLALILLTATATAMWNPVYVWSDIGWYLSYLAFFGVLIVGPLLTEFIWRNRSPGNFMALVVESLSAQIMAAPLIMYIFRELSLISIVSNILIVPLVPLSMTLSLVAGIGGVVLPDKSAWLAWPARVLMSYMLEVVQLLSSVPYARVEWPINLGVLVVIYALIAAACWLMWFKTRPDMLK